MFNSPPGSTVMNSFGGPDDLNNSIPENMTLCDIAAAYLYNSDAPFCDAPTYQQPCMDGDQMNELGCCVPAEWGGGCPLVLDVAGHPIKFSSPEDGPASDLRADGATPQVAWPVAATSGWLVCDFNKNGKIDDGAELFGTATRGLAYTNGFEALRSFDSNADGWIDRRDTAYALLGVWLDANRNGKTEPGEIRSLEQAGVLAISLEYRFSARRDKYGNRFRYSAVAVLEARRGLTWILDVFPSVVMR